MPSFQKLQECRNIIRQKEIRKWPKVSHFRSEMAQFFEVYLVLPYFELIPAIYWEGVIPRPIESIEKLHKFVEKNLPLL